jgi:hypothetical protein
VDWTAALKYIRNSESTGSDFFTTTSIPCEVRFSTRMARSSAEHTARHYLEHFFCDVFLALNLATPGCCNFCVAKIPHSIPLFVKEMGLSASVVEHGWYESTKHHQMRLIPFRRVWLWLEGVIPTVKQVAETNAQRLLFSLFNIFQSWSYSPVQLIWIAHALEAIFKQRPAQGSALMFQRICSAFTIPTIDRKKFSARLRRMYDERHAFVHGGLDIAHPLENEVVDPDLNRYTARLIPHVDFGAQLVVSTAQLLITKNWCDMNFTEQLTGVPLGK